jgi:hypothetical protein
MKLQPRSVGSAKRVIVLTNTNNGKMVEAEVASSSDYVITVYLAGEKIVLTRDDLNKPYVANKFGMELVYKI